MKNQINSIPQLIKIIEKEKNKIINKSKNNHKIPFNKENLGYDITKKLQSQISSDVNWSIAGKLISQFQDWCNQISHNY